MIKTLKSKISNDISHLILSMHSHISMKNFLEKIKKPKNLNLKVWIIFYAILSKNNCYFKISYQIPFLYSIFHWIIFLSKKKKLINKGIFYKIDKWDFCLKNLKEEDIIIIYNCWHILHNKEPYFINNKECKICFLENGKITIDFINEQKKNIIISNEENNIENISISEEDKNINNEKKNIKDIYNKIDNIEEIFLNRKSLIDKNIKYENMKENKIINKRENN